MAAKDPKRQLPDVLHESEGMNAPHGRLMEQKLKPSHTFFLPLQNTTRGMKGKRYRQQSRVITATGAGGPRCRPAAERMCCNNKY